MFQESSNRTKNRASLLIQVESNLIFNKNSQTLMLRNFLQRYQIDVLGFLQTLLQPQHKAAKKINISQNKIGLKEISEIVKYDFPELTRLDLSENNIKDDALSLLIDQSRWPNLVCLNLKSNLITSSGFGKFIESKFAMNLKQIDLGLNRIGKDGIKSLTKINWNCLQKIQLQNCQIGNQALTHLSKIYAPHLTHINLSANLFTYDGYVSFIRYSLECIDVFMGIRQGSSGKNKIDQLVLLATSCPASASLLFSIQEYRNKIVEAMFHRKKSSISQKHKKIMKTRFLGQKTPHYF